ncbi:PD-(D/E)XK nuclease family protein [Clostridium oryzae]|uniref:PD-(D/E)XK nuclease superfamily protein n=1 Tax=Clostridium oryzae TaxID=1450648 RepID=A0A1V4I9A4_9CLOT|nr:PD-(D/E)XK nuclease family protein [Clostridium oryzae]OPJ56107.1 hypothetical protein CLORY_43350 [Clostridium oryzae]
MKPNIFKYATSELSQDAVICWMFEWANTEDKYLNRFSYDFIKAILDLHRCAFIDINKLVGIKLKKQYNSIDILLQLTFEDNSILPIIIESKTYTQEHCNQLKRYYNFVLSENKHNEKVLAPLGVYYNPGFMYENEINSIEKEGYRVFKTDKMIKLMKKYIDKIENDIFIDYYRYLRSIEVKEEELRNLIKEEVLIN